MGLYYAAQLEYPAAANGALMYIQSRVLGDKLHEKDKAVADKAAKYFDSSKDESNENDFFD